MIKNICASMAVCILTLLPTYNAIAQELIQIEESDEFYAPEIDTYTDEQGFIYTDSAKTIIYGYNGSSKTVVIPSTVKEILADAFAYDATIESVLIPSNVTNIGESAFYGCTSLKTVTLNASIAELNHHTFGECTALETVSIPSGVLKIGASSFYNCTSLKSVFIPATVKVIDYAAFIMCTSLTSISIPDSVTTIGNAAFSQCTALTSVEIPDSVTSLGESVFNACTSLEVAVIGDKVPVLQWNAFNGCSSLKNVSLGGSIVTIEWDAFYRCVSLESIVIPNSVKTIEDGVFWECSSLKTIEIPASVTTMYEEHYIQYGTTILCDVDSYAFNYAVANNIPYQLLNYDLTKETVSSISAQSYGKNDVLIKYNANKLADGYLVYGRRGSGATYEYIGMTSNTYLIDTKANDKDYNFYWVFPYKKDIDGKMIAGTIDTYVYAKGVCGAASNLYITSKSNGAQVNWTASREADGYLVYGINGDTGTYGYVGMTVLGTTLTDTKASSKNYNYYWVYPFHYDANKNMVVGLTGAYTYGRSL